MVSICAYFSQFFFWGSSVVDSILVLRVLGICNDNDRHKEKEETTSVKCPTLTLFMHNNKQRATVSNIMTCVAAVLVDINACKHRLQQRTTIILDVPLRRQLRQRRRRLVWDIYDELGAIHFRRAYLMTYQSFKRLAVRLLPYIPAACGEKGLPTNYWNGPISPDVQLACAICW